MSADELALCRERLARLRGDAVAMAEAAVAAVMLRNGVALGLIDGALASLVPMPGESSVAHRCRVDEAMARLELEEMAVEVSSDDL